MSFVFGYGTLISNTSRHTTLSSIYSSDGSSIPVDEQDSSSFLCHLRSSYGYKRSFCFRSSTGFTALGLQQYQKKDEKEEETDFMVEKDAGGIAGIVFRVNEAQLPEFDKREKGYFRKQIPQEFLYMSCGSPLPLPSNAVVYVYIPELGRLAAPSEEYPILQTYVDICLSGCLSWGNESLMHEFCATTDGWSTYYLNDPPMSRRPWLHRPQSWEAIDGVLASQSSWTKFAHRKHAEEYMSSFQSFSSAILLRGMWGCPARNKSFVGRSKQLRHMKNALEQDGLLQICGLGGMGKSSLACEYCHSQFGSTYELIIFIHAETRTSIASDLRRFAKEKLQLSSPSPASSPNASNIGDCSDEFVVEEVRRHLSKCRCRYMIVFDNLEDASFVSSLLSAFNKSELTEGHILVTSRVALDIQSLRGDTAREPLLQLDALSPPESLELLTLSLGEFDDPSLSGSPIARGRSTSISEIIALEDEAKCLEELGNRLFHLPLALSMAIAYMRKCDVSAREYLSRLGNTADATLSRMNSRDRNYQNILSGDVFSVDAAISDSLTMAQDRIALENPAAMSVLFRLAYLAPDTITKPLVKQLVLVGHFKICGPQSVVTDPSLESKMRKESVGAQWRERLFGDSMSEHLGLVGGIAVGVVGVISCFARGGSRRVAMGIGLGFGTSAALVFMWRTLSTQTTPKTRAPEISQPLPSLPLAADVDKSILNSALVETDKVWDTLKTFSLFTVRGPQSQRVASIHRMQQAILRLQVGSGVAGDRLELIVEQCIFTIGALWSITRSDIRSSTSDPIFVDHITTLATHVFQQDKDQRLYIIIPLRAEMRQSFSDLLKQCADYAAKVISRFDVAEGLLHKALVLEAKETCMMRTSSTLHSLGTISRLRGRLAASQRDLGRCLAIREKMADETSCTPTSLTVRKVLLADTLHELGILSLRMNDLQSARTYLSRSLTLKESLQSSMNDAKSVNDARSTEGNDAQALSFGTTTLSASLYQLAIIATAEKLYDSAEQLLNRALACENGTAATTSVVKPSLAQPPGPSTASSMSKQQLVSRAACVQQLGRIALRRGNTALAQSRFEDSLEQYTLAYGQSCIHINVAAVRMQLGLTYSAARDYIHASEEFAQALEIKYEIYGRDTTHAEIASTLQALAQCFQDRGMLEEAKAHFSSAKYMFDKLSEVRSEEQERNAFAGNVGAGADEITGGSRRTRAKLVRNALFCTYALSRIAGSGSKGKSVGNTAGCSTKRGATVTVSTIDGGNEVLFWKAEIDRLNELLRHEGESGVSSISVGTGGLGCAAVEKSLKKSSHTEISAEKFDRRMPEIAMQFDELPDNIKRLSLHRLQLKSKKLYAEADNVRTELAKAGYIVKDKSGGKFDVFRLQGHQQSNGTFDRY